LTEWLIAGVNNLLHNCAKIQSGERLLLVGESGPNPFYEPGLCDSVARVIRHQNIDVRVIHAIPGKGADDFPERVLEAMQKADVTIFFSRLGDQVRFVESAGPGRKVMAYTLTKAHLTSPFATTDFDLMSEVEKELISMIRRAQSYRISHSNGTDLYAEMTQNFDMSGEESSSDSIIKFSVQLFPVVIFPPIELHHLNGTLVLEHFLTSSSTRAYENSVLMLDSPVRVDVEDSIMTEFKGNAAVVSEVRNQLEQSAAITGGNPYQLNSWHTGINPHTFFKGNPFDDLERWGTVTFGSPRYTHIHAAGHDPGDCAIQLFDCDIWFDDQQIWDSGRMIFADKWYGKTEVGDIGISYF
jgi:hypothetical protein